MENTTQETAQAPEKKYWKSIEEWQADPATQDMVENEFMSSPLAEEDGKDGYARREFMKLMGASLALGSFACVRRPTQKIVPYAKRPVEIIPGVANYYTSSLIMAGEGFGLVVKTREGRPIKLEGNPAHPENLGALSSRAQAHILSLYDPERIKGPMKPGRDGKKTSVTWDELDAEVVKSLKEGEVALLSSSLASPSTSQIIGDFFQAYKGTHYVWDPVGPDDVIEGQKRSYGQSVLPRYRFDKSKMIVSIEGDFLGTLISPVGFSKSFSQSRKAGKEMNRLVVFEANHSLTGANADVRVNIRASEQVAVAMGLAYEIVVKQGRSRYAGDAGIKSQLAGFADMGSKLHIGAQKFSQIAEELWANKGQSIVIGGGLSSRTASGVSLQVAINFLNSVLENDGATIDASTPYKSYQGSYSQMAALIDAMNAGKISTLLIHKVNPIYALPADSGFAEALKKVKTVVYLGDRVDETGSLADFVAPDHHDLENWSDSEIIEGVFAVQQPTIRPLYETRSMQGSLMTWAYMENRGPQRMIGVDSWYDYVKNVWKGYHGRFGGTQSFENFWTKCLHEGVLDTKGDQKNKTSGARAFNTASLKDIKANSVSGLELVLFSSIPHADGSLANVSWLQELPDPVTKIVWDSVLLISPLLAQKEGLKNGDVVNLSVGGRSVEVPVWQQVGLNQNVLALAVGLGRTKAGLVGSNVGVNGFALASFNKGMPIFAGLNAEMKSAGRSVELANTQGHHYMEGRQIVAETTLEEFSKDEGAGIHRHKTFSLWPEHKYEKHRWGMSIDLNSCTGCSACVTACQSENNIPVVGKKYVLRGREMHWMRIDRYYSGKPTDAAPDSYHQPMLCQHCENAPCETVCPVAATVHDDEGLNSMIYNRCVGTRYCSNNCPYKVRRFNWFNYIIDEHPYSMAKKPLNMALNPSVTVRSRGVMEKCTFCVQRIHEAKNDAKDNGTTVKDGDVTVACEQSCPTNAIVFGDMNDPKSRVSQLFNQKRTYQVLEELNVLPSVRYMSKIRNDKREVVAHHGAGHQEGGH